MRNFLVSVRLAGLFFLLAGCSGDQPSDDKPDDDSGSVLLITRGEGMDDSTWMASEGRLRIREGCILFNGQLVALPYGTRLVERSTAVQLDEDSEPVPLDGEADVRISGSEVPLGGDGAWEHAMDQENLDRWSECRRRAEISEYADWWQLTDVTQSPST